MPDDLILRGDEFHLRIESGEAEGTLYVRIGDEAYDSAVTGPSEFDDGDEEIQAHRVDHVRGAEIELQSVPICPGDHFGL